MNFLAGAHAADQHFFHTEYRHNIPVLMGLLGIWYSNFHHAESHAVIPYSNRLRRLPAHLQQLDMESNGKHTTLHGEETPMQQVLLFGVKKALIANMPFPTDTPRHTPDSR